jgi:hypothetical protein
VPRKPVEPLTAAEAKQARYWLKRVGLEVPSNLLPREGGRPKLDGGPMFWKSLELFLRSMKRTRGMNRTAALRWLVDLLWPLYETGTLEKFGKNPNAIVVRLRRNLQKGGYDKRDAKKLVPREWLKRGIDPETFINFPVTKGDLRRIDPEKFTPARKLARLKRLPSPNPKGGTAFIVTETDDD